ncbi:MAG: TrbJ/VirB5 family protein [Rhodocyclaceae bacterium]
MKPRRLSGLLAAAMLATTPAMAGGGGIAGATEITQILNNAQLVQQYATQAQQYVTQLQQTQTMLTNLMENPLGVLSPDVLRIANNMAKLHSMGKDIGSSVARVDENFAKMFNSAEAMNFAEKFKTWTEGSTDGLKSAMQNAGMQREQFADDATALQELTKRVSSSQGNLAALKTLGNINAKQIEESMKLRDLIATQQLATNQHLIAQAQKEQKIDDMNARLWQFENKPLPTPRPKKPGQF